MAKRCGICGKTAVFGTLLKCASCGQHVCHRHDWEQFNAISICPEDSFGHTQINYPKGELIKSHFRCYKCRTGKIPQDMGVRKWPLSEKIFFVYFFAAIAIFLFLVTVFMDDGSLGFTEGQMELAWSLCWVHVFINLIIFIFLLMRQKRKGHMW